MAPSSSGPSALALAALLACASTESGPPDRSPYLHVVELTQARAGIDLSRPLRLEAYTDDPRALALKLAPLVQSREADHVVLEARSYPVLPPADPSAFLAATFVVDYDEPAVVVLSASLRQRYGDRPTPEQIVAFIRETLTPSTARSFDIASQVATHLSGDCTEHAVLFAALARSVEIPTRIASGIVILRDQDELGAFGHAWAETHDGSQWRPIDPTDLEGTEPIAYLPEGILQNEGPGYVFGLARTYLHGIERIVVVANPPP